MAQFAKRFYTPRRFLQDFWGIMTRMSEFRDAARSGRVSRAFAEKIMMAVTQVNGCRYCAYFHTQTALREGVSPDELEKLMALELGDFPEEEAVALAFAQHWAESGGDPDDKARQRFEEFYSPQVSADILAWIRMITFGNLAGNTVDAFLSRLRGKPAAGSHVLGELLLFVVCAPFTLPLLPKLRRSGT